MPIFEYEGKKYNVQDEHMDIFKEQFPDAEAILEKEGKKYRVKSADYFLFTNIDTNQTALNRSSEDSLPANAKKIDPDTYSFEDLSTVAGQLRAAEERLSRYSEQEDKRRKELQADMDSEKESMGFLAKIAFNRVNPITGHSLEQLSIESDSDVQALRLAKRKTEDQIQQLEDYNTKQRRGEKFLADFGREAGQILIDEDSWDFGQGVARDASTMLRLKAKMDNGEELSDAETSALEELYLYDNVINAYGDLGRGAEWGSIAGNSVSFMKDFLLTGGFKGAVTQIPTKVATKVATNAIKKASIDAAESIGVKVAQEGLKKVIREGGKGTVKKLLAEQGKLGAAKILATKGLGVAAEDLLIRAPLMTTTVQGQNLASDIINTKLGPVIEDEKGEFRFYDDTSWGEAAWEATADRVIENASEMWGSHLPGITDITKTIGARNLTSVILRATRSGAGTVLSKTSQIIEKLGINGIAGEALEEYYGQALRTIADLESANNVDGINNFLDSKWHGDIWGGMAMTVGLTGGVTATGYYGVNRPATYIKHKAEMQLADHRAATLLPNMWDDIKLAIDTTENKDIGAFSESILTDNTMSVEQRQAILNYILKSQTFRGYNLGEYMRRKYDTPNPSMEQIEQSYFDGYNATQSQEMSDTRNTYEYQKQKAIDVLGEDALSLLDSNPVNELASMSQLGYSEEEMDIARDYVNSKYVYDGMIQRVRDDIDSRIDQSDAMVDSRINKTSGMINGATMKVDDRKVYIVSGSVVPFADGSGIDHQASDNSVIIRDAQTGALEQVSPESIFSVDEALDPEREKEIARLAIQEEFAQDAENKIEGKVTTFNPGDQYTITAGDGTSQTVQVVANEAGVIDNGDGTVNVTDGTQIFPLPIDVIQQSIDAQNAARVAQQETERQAQRAERRAEYKQKHPDYVTNDEISFSDSQGNIVNGVVEDITEDGILVAIPEGNTGFWHSTLYPKSIIDDGLIRYNGSDVNTPTPTDENVEMAEQSTEAPIADEQITTVEPTVVAPEEELSQLSATGRIPIDEQGNPLYEQSDPDTAWDAILEQTEGDEAMAQTVAESMLADKEAQLKKIEKAKPKAKENATIADKIAAEKEKKNALAQAQSEIDAWKKITQVSARRKMAEQDRINRELEAKAAEEKAQQEQLRAEQEEKARIEREALEGVPDMINDTPADARARGYRRVNGHQVIRQEPINVIPGKEVAIKFANDRIADGNTVLIDASQLQPSHINGQRNPLHFIDEAQPKERKDEASVLASQKIASAIRPEEITSSVTAYTGAPTVNTRGEVIQGNNRSAALLAMYAGFPEQSESYKQYLKDHAGEFGISAEDVDKMQSPILVNMLNVDDNTAIELGQYVAQDTESGGIERIKPKNTIQRMGSDMPVFANMLLQSTDEETSFAGLIDNNGADVLKWMAQRDYITPTQYRSAFDSKGNLTAEAKNDLKGIMYQSIFQNGSTQLEEMFNLMPAKAQRAILATAFRDYNSPDAERMNAEIQNSIRAYYALSQDAAFMAATNFKEARAAIEAWKIQYQMDDATGVSYLPADNFSNFALHLAAMYKGESQSLIQGTFNKMYDLIQGTQEESLFEQPDNTPRTLVQAIKETLNIEYNGQPRSNVLAGNSAAGQREQSGSTGTAQTGERIENGEQSTDDSGRAESSSVQGEISESKPTTEKSVGTGYTVEPAQYTTKRGKVLDMHLVKFGRELTKEEQRNAKALAKELKGWYDSKQGGFMMRSAEDAQQIVDAIMDESGETLADAAPVSLSDVRKVNVESLMGALSEQGEATLSEHSEPVAENLDELEERTRKETYDELYNVVVNRKNIPDVSAIKSAIRHQKERIKVLTNGAATNVSSDEDLRNVERELAITHGRLKAYQEFDKYIKERMKEAEAQATAEESAPVVEQPKNEGAFGLVSDARMEELKARLRKKLGGQLNMGIDPEILAIGMELAAGHIDRGVKSFADFAKRMVEDLGDMIRPYLKAFYNGARDMPEIVENGLAAEMTPYDEVSSFDVANFDKAHSDPFATAEMVVSEQEKIQQAEEAKQEIVKQRNTERRKDNEQTSANSETIASQAATVEAEVQRKIEEATTSEELDDAIQQADNVIERIDEQLEDLGATEYERKADEPYSGHVILKDGRRVAILMVCHKGEQIGAAQFSAPVIERYYAYHNRDLIDFKPEDIDEVATKALHDRENGIIEEPQAEDTESKVQKVENKQSKKSKFKKNSVTSQTDLLGSLFEDETLNNQGDERISEESATRSGAQRGSDSENGTGRTDRRSVLSSQGGDSGTIVSVDEGGVDSNIQGRRNDRRGDSSLPGGESKSETVRSRRGLRNDAVEADIAPSERKNTHNNHSQRGANHAPTSVDARIEANIKSIELAQQLTQSGEQATEQQMKTLRKFSGWGGLGKAFSDSTYSARIQELLGAEAYQEAVMSANSAYYTPAYVVDTLWDIATQMGFKGGNILEGSAGIGNILGQMPTSISERSDIHAIEIDRTSGGILSLLYPDAKVEIQGFEDTRIPNGSVDLAITNVPFVTGLRVNDTTGDKDLSKKFHNIHDFCIAKNVRKLREGGIGLFITSNGTLDNSKKLRDWIVNEGGADFIGAFRMHNKTFGGTGVTSDIIVIRKRVNGRKSANAIDVSTITGERSAEFDTGEKRKVKGEEVAVIKHLAMDYNRYFIEHPENMAGVMQFAFEQGETFRPTSKGLYPVKSKNQEQMLAEFVGSFKEETEDAVILEESSKTGREYVMDASADGKKLGELYVKDGKLVIAGAGGYYPLSVNANKVKGHTKVECFNAYAAIKEALAEVLAYQTENESNEGLKPLLAKLNKAYDSFVATYGHFNKNTAISFLRNDVDYPNVFSLERYEETGDKSGNRIQKFGKADVFSQRVVEKEKEPTPTNVKDGIIASVFKFGRIDASYIAEQLGKSVDEVKSEIIESGYGFEDPATRQMELSYQYLSGNVREKLRQAQENNEDGAYDRNIKALQEVVPMDIPAHLIDFTLGSSWITPKLYEEYVKERTDIEVKFTAAGGTWYMDAPYYVNKEKNRSMGVYSEMFKTNIFGHTLIEAAISNKTVTVSRTNKKWDGSTETITDREATQACSAKIDEIRQDFKDWARQKMQSDAEMSADMERLYNDTFNNYVPMSIPPEFAQARLEGQALIVKGKEFSLFPHQSRAIVRGTMQPLLLAHEVGTGKTFTLISTAMEMRRLGTARKPMIVVQNATVGQFVASAKELYPNAKILTLEEADRTAEGRKNFYAKIRHNDWDMIVVPQSTFEFIPDSEERQMQFVQDKIEEKMTVLEKMQEADPRGESMITRQAKKEIADLEAQLADLSEQASSKRSAAAQKKREVTLQNAEVQALEMLDRRTDDVENFDDMGIDALLVDEAHEYKHLGFATAMQRGVKGVDASYSKKSQGVYLKTQAVLEKNNGRNVIFATGTPISNTAAEIWTFMRYLMTADTMKEYGIYYFDDFVRNFGNIQQMLEFTTSGKFKENNRFAGYVNLPELVRIWSGVSDTVLTKEAGGVSDKIPEMEGGKAQDLYLPQTRALRSIMKFVKAELMRYEEMSGKEKKANSHIPLTMYGIAKSAAVDARLVDAGAEDDPNSKTNEAVRQTLRSLKETAKYKGTVAIFSDNYQNKASGFNLYDDIKEKLIAEGVPADEVVVIRSGMTVKKKLDIFEKVNRGEIRVVLGSTFTLGTGVNIQERLHTVIHLDAPNRPMDYTQRNGRILRQGNLHKAMGKPVRILRFGVEDSLDVTAYQRLKTKGAIADSIMNGKQMMANSMTNRVLEEEEDVFGDTVAQLSGSEYALLKNNAEKNVRKYESRKKGWEADQTYIHNAKPRYRGQIAEAEQRAETNRKFLQMVQDAFPDGKFTEITAGKQTFATVEDMADFFKEHNKKVLEKMKQMKEGGDDTHTRELTVSLGGYTFKMRTVLTKDTSRNGGQLFAEVHRQMSYSCPELGLEDVPVYQNLLRNAIEDIVTNVITGKDYAERAEAAERKAKHLQSELEQILSREGVPFEFEEELAQARAQYVEYSELMKKEMEEKEAKYAEMDKTVEAASDIATTEDEDDLMRDGELTEFNALFNEELQEQIEGTLPQGHIYQLGMPSEVLRSAGIKNLPIELSAERLQEKSEQPNHPFFLSNLRGLPKSIAEPIAVFDSKTQTNSSVILTELQQEGVNFVVILKVRRSGNNIDVDVNSVRSLYPKDNVAGIIDWINNGLLRYADKERLTDFIAQSTNLIADNKAGVSDEWISKQRYNSADVRKLFNHPAKVVESFENPSIENNNISREGSENNISPRVLRKQMAERVRKLADMLHLDNVEVLTTVSGLDEKHRNARGFYNKRTGKITIVIPNNASLADVEQTLLHEAVAHYGLRKMFGTHLDTFLDNVFNNADESIRRKIVELATKNGWDFRKATEEYLAGLAERTNFEEARKSGWWHRIKQLFSEMLDKLGFVNFRGVTLTDNELRYILWRSYENLRSGTPEDIFGKAADIAMQYNLNVGEYANTLEAVNRRFNEELAGLTKDNANSVRLNLGMPSKYLLSIGIQNKPLLLYGNKLIAKSKKHNFKIDEIKNLPIAIQNPIAVFKGSKKDSFAILTEININGNNVLATLSVGRGNDIDFNIISSTYGKDSEGILRWINKEKLLYVDKEKALDYLRISAPIAEAQSNQELDSFAKIIENFENPIIEDENDTMFRDVEPEERQRVAARERYERRLRSGMFQMKEAMQDSMLGLEEAYKAILGKKFTTIEDVAGFENAYLGENRLSSVNKAEADAMSRLIFKPMLDEVAKLAKNEAQRQELTDYMFAKHGLERNEYMAKRDAQKEYDKYIKEHPKGKKTLLDFINEYRKRDYAGLLALSGEKTNSTAEAEARRIVDEYEQSHDTAALWKKVNAVSRAILSKSYEGGLINKETFNNISNMYEYYIPLRGFDEKTSAEAYAYLNHSNSAFNAPIKKASGRTSKADDPFANLEAMAESTIMQANRNKLVKQRFLNFVLNHPSDLASVSELWIKYDEINDEWAPVFPDNIEEDDSAEDVERKMRNFEERMQKLAKENPDLYKKGEDAVNIPYRVVEKNNLHQHQIVVKRNGQDYVITINGNPRAAQVINGQTNPDNDLTGAIGKVFETMEKVNRQLSAFYTTRNPDFVVSNFLRDMLLANSMVWIKESPNYALRFHKNYGKANPAMMKILLARYRNNTLNMDNPIEKMFHQFMMNGGETGYSNLRDLEQHKNDIKRELKKANGKIGAAKAMDYLGERLDEYNRAIENCARFAAFMTSREMGRNMDRAIYDAKEISVNFNKKGSGSKFLNKQGQTKLGNTAAFISGSGRTLYVFWNAAIQGTFGNFVKNAKRHPVKAITAAATMFLLGAIISGLGADDDEDSKNSYFNQPDYVRRSNILFRAGEHWISIPLPVEYRAVYGMGELMMSVLRGKEHLTTAEIATEVASQMSQMLPINFLEGDGGLGALTPSAAKPLVETFVTEKSWTGMPLYKDTPWNKNMPEWTKAYKNADKELVNLAAVLNEATGGDEYTKGWIDINPAKIENLLNGYFGGYASTIEKLKKTAETIFGDREYDPRNVLLLNRIVKAGDESTENRAINNEYFRLKEEHDEIKRRLRNYERDTYNGIFDYAEKIDYLYNSPEYERMLIFEDYNDYIQDINEELKLADPTDKDYIKSLEDEAAYLKREMIKEMELTRK